MKKILAVLIMCLVAITVKAQWVKSDGDFPWYKRSITQSLNGDFFVGCDSGIVMRTSDFGIDWEVHRIPSCPSRIWALDQGPDSAIYAGSFGNGLFRSFNNGVTWDTVTSPEDYVRQFVKGPDGTLYMLCGVTSLATMYFSTDTAQTWDTLNSYAAHPNGISVSPYSGEVILSTDSFYYVSSDSGQTWVQSSMVYANRPQEIYRYLGSDTLYMKSTTGTLYSSNNNGGTWINDGSTTTIYVAANGVIIFGQSSGYIWSSDGGGVFNVPNGPTNNVVQFAYDESAGLMLTVGGTSQMQVATILGSTYYTNNYLGIQQVGSRIFSSANDSIMFAGYPLTTDTKVIYMSADNGKNWEQAHVANHYLPRCYVRLPNDTFLMGTLPQSGYNGIIRSVNGLDWTPSGLPNTQVDCMLLLPDVSVVISTASFGIFRSTDNGHTWMLQTALNQFDEMAVSDSTGTLIGRLGAQIYRSVDQGVTWTMINNFFVSTSLSAVAFNPLTKSFLFAGAGGGVYRSDDDGQTWNAVGTGLPLPATADGRKLCITPDGQLFLLLNNLSVYSSIDDGNSWVLHSTALADRPIGVNAYQYLFTGGGLDIYKWNQQLSGNFSSAHDVWPGDANDDLVANSVDVLSIGLYYGQSGPARSGIDNSWSAHTSPAWNNYQYNNADLKHADCNGDGIVNDDDTLAIILNAGQTHTNRMGLQQNQAVGTPVRMVRLTGSVVAPGDSMRYAVFIGDVSTPATNFYGAALTLWQDPSLVVPALSVISYTYQNSPAWLSMHFAPNQMYGVSIVRTDHLDTSGVIQIGVISFIAEPGILLTDTFTPQLTNLMVIDQLGNEVAVAVESDTTIIDPAFTSVEIAEQSPEVVVWPSPVKDNLNVFSRDPVHSIVVFDCSGRIIEEYNISDTKQAVIDASEWPVGLMFIQVNTEKGVVTKRVVRY